MNWDDIKIFLAMIRYRTVRAAADKLDMSHSTVARRIVALEKRIGVRLFNRTGLGYELTTAGWEIKSTAENMEREVLSLERRVIGRDQRLRGHVRVATLDFLATHLLIPNWHEFAVLYPEINIEMLTGYQALDIDKREADIALRSTRKPPPNLIGKRVGTVAFAPYATRDYVQQYKLMSDDGPEQGACWIGYERPNRDGTANEWVARTRFPRLPVRWIHESLLSQLAAARAGLGVGMLPCLLGDSEPALMRLPDGVHQDRFDIWLLTHRDVRTTARLRAVMHYMSQILADNAGRLDGSGIVTDRVA